MKESVADKLITALESGEYKQGKHWLRRDDCFCIFGVLHDLAVKEGILEECYRFGTDLAKMESVKIYSYTDNEATILPVSQGIHPSVKEWAGMLEYSPWTGVLMRYNDKGMSFQKLANFIREKRKYI